MPSYVWDALFVTVGLLLVRVLCSLLRTWEQPKAYPVLHALMGLVMLLVGRYVGSLFGAAPGLNLLTVSAAATLGVPGVGLLWALLSFV